MPDAVHMYVPTPVSMACHDTASISTTLGAHGNLAGYITKALTHNQRNFHYNLHILFHHSFHILCISSIFEDFVSRYIKMAEAAGLALGIVALTSLFKDCVDLFVYIESARNSSREYKILETKLDIERTLLLQWEQRVRLTSRDRHDRRLDDRTTHAAVLQILGSISQILGQASLLHTRYGLEAVERPTLSDEVQSDLPADLQDEGIGHSKSSQYLPSDVNSSISGAGIREFTGRFKALGLEKKTGQNKNLRMTKFRWAIWDKDKFESLVKDLSYFTTKLNELLPAKEFEMVSMARSSLKVKDFETLRLVLDGSTDDRSAIIVAANDLFEEKNQKRVHNRVWFRVMDDRLANVHPPHYSTLDWVLEQTDEKYPETTWDSLYEWLRNGQGLYWVSGKAGSGKSTLIKHIYRQDKTNDLLREWAGNGQFRKGNFFFWALGTELQKSNEGISRALLFSILDSDLQLIPDMLPGMWKEACQAGEATLSPPSKAEIATAFQIFRERQKRGSRASNRLKYWFFIDGLDEYSGNCMDTIDFIEDLATIPDVKIFVSSRPISSCELAFAARPKLRLQDLTRDDIRSYVKATLEPHLRMETTYDDNEERADHIIQDIVKKANGVFLWVILACRSVREGLAAHDFLHEIQRRVDDLPPELEDLFRQMLGRQEPRYRAQGAKILRLCYENKRRTGVDGMPTIGLALTDEFEFQTGLFSHCEHMHLRKIQAKCRSFEGRVRSRCCGLLEIHRRPGVWREQCWCGCPLHGDFTHNEHVDSTVCFMHRTVYEFLDSFSGKELECLEIQDESFNADLILAWISVHLTKLSLKSFPTRHEQMHSCIQNTLEYCRRTPCQHEEKLVPTVRHLVDFLNRLIISQDGVEFIRGKWSILKVDDHVNHISLDRVARVVGIERLIKMLEVCDTTASSKNERVNPFQTELENSVRKHCESGIEIQRLLSLGCDPNRTFLISGGEVSPWTCWLEKIRVCAGKIRLTDITVDMMEHFVRAGSIISQAETIFQCSLADLLEQSSPNYHALRKLPGLLLLVDHVARTQTGGSRLKRPPEGPGPSREAKRIKRHQPE